MRLGWAGLGCERRATIDDSGLTQRWKSVHQSWLGARGSLELVAVVEARQSGRGIGAVERR